MYYSYLFSMPGWSHLQILGMSNVTHQLWNSHNTGRINWYRNDQDLATCGTGRQKNNTMSKNRIGKEKFSFFNLAHHTEKLCRNALTRTNWNSKFEFPQHSIVGNGWEKNKLQEIISKSNKQLKVLISKWCESTKNNAPAPDTYCATGTDH